MVYYNTKYAAFWILYKCMGLVELSLVGLANFLLAGWASISWWQTFSVGRAYGVTVT